MNQCISCGGKLFQKPLLKLDNMPASAQNIPSKEEVERDKGITLQLRQCSECGLVQFDCEPVDYYRDVIRAGGFSTTMVELRRKQYGHLIKAYHLEQKKFIEAGCGRGEFLSVLTEFPVKAWGIEHKKELVEIARNSGLEVTEEFPETETQKFLGGPFDCFLSFNFLEHQPRPDIMLRAIRNNLTESGMGLVTVPSLEYILQYDGYYELIRDHLAYYTFDSLRELMERNGFQVLEEEMINRDTLSVIVKKADLPDSREKSEKIEKIKPLDVSGLKKSREIIDQEINSLLDSFSRTGRKLAVWGASHQGFTLAATTGLGEKACYMIDSAPFKQGRFAPASHLKIVSPDYWKQEPAEGILIVAPGYNDEIARIIREKFVLENGKNPEIFTLKSNHLERL